MCVHLGRGSALLDDCPMKGCLRLNFRLPQVPYSSTRNFLVPGMVV